MLELILQLFGGRGAGSGNKGGGHQTGTTAAGLIGSGKNGALTISDLVKSKRTFDKEDPDLYDRSQPIVQAIIDKVMKLRDANRNQVQTIKFTHVNRDTGEITIQIGWSNGTVTTKTVHTKKKK